MKTFRCCVLLLCTFLLALPASAKNKITRFEFEFAGHQRIMYLVVPEKNEPMPVVVLLHGSGRNGEIMAQAWKDIAGREGFIVAAPDAFDSQSWNSLMDPPEFFRSIVDQLKEIHAIDESRIYLFGHSAGAAYALFLAVVDFDLFAATAIHAGALQTDPEGLFDQSGRKMPVAIWVGDHDAYFPVDTVEETRRLLANNGFPVRLTLIPHHDHNYYAIADEMNAKAWAFLKAKRLETAPAAQ